MRNRLLAAVLTASTLMAAGCIGFERKSTLSEPAAAGSGALMGTWTSANIIPSPASCTNFVWNVSEQTQTSARGSFSARCAGDLNVTGTAQGNITGPASISWTGTANATGPGLTSCTVTLSGTAELLVDAIRIPYAGDTCLGRVSGTETLQRR
jgi:hypothetical protein